MEVSIYVVRRGVAAGFLGLGGVKLWLRDILEEAALKPPHILANVAQ